VIYLKNQDRLEFVNEEHLHDLGKFMFAFSIFWTYLWFSQFMLIWYANIPEETIYLPRMYSYRGILPKPCGEFCCANFDSYEKEFEEELCNTHFRIGIVDPGHWMDFYQMVMGTIEINSLVGLNLESWLVCWPDDAFVGRHSAKRHWFRSTPYLKESIIHHT
jgi:hypothetical protein